MEYAQLVKPTEKMCYHVRVEHLEYNMGEKVSKPFVAQYTMSEFPRVVKNMVVPGMRFEVLYDPTKPIEETVVEQKAEEEPKQELTPEMERILNPTEAPLDDEYVPRRGRKPRQY